jgi:hypothetical protein
MGINMDGIYLLFCLAMIVFLAFVVLLILSIRPGSKKEIKQKGGRRLASDSVKADSPPMDKEIRDLLKSLNANDKLTIKTKALTAFRVGTPETKKRALEVLLKLGEVEKF